MLWHKLINILINNTDLSVIYFDFCETLVSFQTADAFVDFVRSKKPSFRMKFFEVVYLLMKKMKFFGLLERIFPEKSIEKKVKLFQLKNENQDVLKKLADEFYISEIRNKFIPDIFEIFKKYYANKNKIIVISGGYEIYLQSFIDEYPNCELIATKLAFKNGRFTGYIQGADCLYSEKVNRLLSGNYPQNKSVAYSDSSTDLPLLKWVDQGIVISRKQQQKWATRNNLQEIVWHP